MNSDKPALDLSVNAIRVLAIDAVEAAGSGHPGTPMGLAPVAFALWRRLRHDPQHPDWPDRDRFVLSCGHASMLLYALLHLSGYKLPIEEIKRFRQLGSMTPGHPEYGRTPGVEATTGPLGQGFANAVGMAFAEKMLAEIYNRPDFPVVNHRTWTIVSDGDLMEGITAEAASLAGLHKLDKLVCIYDDNKITIEGDAKLAFREDVLKRFSSYGWNTIGPIDGDNTDHVAQAIEQAVRNHDGPTIITARTTIGWGSPNKAGKASAHGQPLGAEEARLTKEALGWRWKPFVIPEQAYKLFSETVHKGAQERLEWVSLMDKYRNWFPKAAETFERRLAGELPEDWDTLLEKVAENFSDPVATRQSSGAAIEAIAAKAPFLIGGSADLAHSNNTFVPGRGSFQPETPKGRNIHFGVREHAMGAISNGIALHRGFLPYAGTFLVFSDYMRGAIRLSALSGLKTIWVFTHDSIGVGEDGPTHQPVSQLMSLRLIPGLTTIRPADAAETIEAWRIAVQRNTPTAIVLTRQKTPLLASLGATEQPKGQVEKGAYIVKQAQGRDPDIVLIGTGSETAAILEAATILESENIAVRVVSMPSWELFEEQPEEYRQRVIPSRIPTRIAVEAGSSLGWDKYVGERGVIVAMRGFGTSAPFKDAYKEFGFMPSQIAEKALEALQKNRNGQDGTTANVCIGVAADHHGINLKDAIAKRLISQQYNVVDLGATSFDPEDDYPDFAAAAAQAVTRGDTDKAIVVCGSGVGAAIAANKIAGARAAICHDAYSADQGVRHDDMNVLCLGAKVIGEEVALEAVEAFARARFDSQERYVRRVDKVLKLEKDFKNE